MGLNVSRMLRDTSFISFHGQEIVAVIFRMLLENVPQTIVLQDVA